MGARIHLSQEQVNQIKEFISKFYGTRKIAKLMNITRDLIKRVLREESIDISMRTPQRFAYKYTEKLCSICKKVKLIDFF